MNVSRSAGKANQGGSRKTKAWTPTTQSSRRNPIARSAILCLHSGAVTAQNIRPCSTSERLCDRKSCKHDRSVHICARQRPPHEELTSPAPLAPTNLSNNWHPARTPKLGCVSTSFLRPCVSSMRRPVRVVAEEKMTLGYAFRNTRRREKTSPVEFSRS